MKHIQQYTADDVDESPRQLWVRAVDLEAVLKQFPKGMEHCTFKVLECEKGHGRLTAANWVDPGCSACAQEKLREELESVRAKAIAAVWLIPEDHNIQGLQQLAKEAREVLAGKDKQTIAKLQDELACAQEAYRTVQRPPRPGINVVYGVYSGNKAESTSSIRWALPLLAVNYASNGGLEIEVQLP